MFNHLSRFEPKPLERFTHKDKRWYRDTDRTFAYPSVTTVLEINKSVALERWRQSVGVEKAAKIAQDAADRGTAVHHLCEQYLRNEVVTTNDRSQVEIDMFQQFRLVSKRITNIDAIEMPLYSHTLRVAGTADCIAEYEGVQSLIDFKTSTKVKTREQITNYWYQTSMYAISFNEMYEQAIDQVVIMIFTQGMIEPIIFKDKIDTYVEPALNVIDRFYATA